MEEDFGCRGQRGRCCLWVLEKFLRYNLPVGKNICVFCSVNDVEEKYIKDAQDLAKVVVSHGYGLIYGGSDIGLMKFLASSV